MRAFPEMQTEDRVDDSFANTRWCIESLARPRWVRTVGNCSRLVAGDMDCGPPLDLLSEKNSKEGDALTSS